MYVKFSFPSSLEMKSTCFDDAEKRPDDGERSFPSAELAPAFYIGYGIGERWSRSSLRIARNMSQLVIAYSVLAAASYL